MRWLASRVLVVFVLLSSIALFAMAGCGREDLLSWDVPDASTADVSVDATTDAPPGDAGTDVRTDGPLPDGGTLVSLAITPPTATVAVGSMAKLRAIGTFSDNTTQDLTAAAKWTSDAAKVASVAGGVVTGNAPGTTKVHAAVSGKNATASVTVPSAPIVRIVLTPLFATIDVGAAQPFTATATLADNTTQDVTATATWSSSAPQVASVNAGLATALAAGNTTIAAQVGGVIGKAQLTVNGGTLVSIQLTPTNPVVGVNVTFPFTATGTYSDGSVADVTTTATWDSSAPMTLAISATGVARTLVPGTSIVTATIGNVVGQTTVTVTSATLTGIQVTPPTSTIPIKGTEQLTATGTYSDGTTFDLTQSVTWSSSPAGIVGVSNAQGSQGMVTGLAAGTATVTAQLGAVSGTAQVTVQAATLQSIAITPPSPTVPIGTTLPFVARGTYSDGSVLDVTTSASWSTDDPNVATVSNTAGSQGVATANGVGTTGVHATLAGVTGSTTITVTTATVVSIQINPATSTLPLGDKEQLRAVGTFSDGSTADVTAQAVWSSNATSVATVSNAAGAQGLVTATGAGTATISATLQGVTGTATVNVTQPTLAQISVSPIQPSVPAGQRIQFQAIAIFTNGTQQNVTAQAQWTSSNTMVATINATGRATAVAAGTTTISATWSGLVGFTTMTVTSAVAVSVEVTPIDPTMPMGTTQQFVATAIYSDNTSQNVTQQATWQSSSPNVAAVTTGGARGRVTAIAAGQAVISATWQELTGSSTVTVTSATVVSISITPAQWSAPAGTTHQFTAQAIYSDNTSRDVTAQATWVSSDPSTVGVDDARNKGLATAIKPGTATISATYQGVTGNATFTVTAATVSFIDVSPIDPTVAAGVPVRFTATAIFSDNTSQNVTGQATWLSSNSQVAAVSDAAGSKGVTQTFVQGQATISATWQGVTGSTVITVTAATLTQIQVTPFAPTLPVGFATQFQATGIYSDNTTQDLTGLATWTSSATSIAAVSDSAGTKGRVSPLSPGQATIAASYQGVTGTDVVTVSSATLASIDVTPASATIAVGATQPFTANGNFSDGSTMDVTTYVTWLSSTPAIASISNAGGSQGQAKGLSAGTVTITAVRSGVQGTAQLTVR